MRRANDFVRRQTMLAMVVYMGCAVGIGWSCMLPTQPLRLAANAICAAIMTWIIVVRSIDPRGERQPDGTPAWFPAFTKALFTFGGLMLFGAILSNHHGIRPDPYLRQSLAQALAFVGMASMKDSSTLRGESARRSGDATDPTH